MNRFLSAWLVLLMAATVAPAEAVTTRSSAVTLRDGSADVWTAPVGGDAYRLTPERRVGDVLRMRVVHRHRAVTVRLTFVELRRKGEWAHEFAIRRKTGPMYAQVESTGRRPAGRHHLWQQDGDRLVCHAMSHTIDYADDIVTLRIPRICIGVPRWVRVRNYVVHETGSVVTHDNPHNHEPHPAGFTKGLYRR